MLEGFNVVDSRVNALKGLVITEDKVTVIKDSFFIVDKEFFETSEVEVNNIEMLATFTLYVRDEEDPNTVYPFNFKLMFPLKVYFTDSIPKGNEVMIVVDEGTDILQDSFYRNDVNTAYHYFVRLMTGKFNDELKLSYTELLESFKKVMEENEIGGHSSLEFEIFLQALCKAPDGETPFRHVAKSNSGHREFTMINIRDVPRLESAFNAISSENVNTGILKTLIKKSDISSLSPLERIALGKGG